MRSLNRSTILAALFAATLAGCASKPVDETPVDTGDTTSTMDDSSTYGVDDASSIEEAGSSAMDEAKALLSTRVFYFDFDKSTIKPEAYEALKAHAEYLSLNSSASVRLEGHADERGTREYNIALGERRGKAVEKFLRVNGVSGSQIEVISYGEEKPVAFGKDEYSYSQNRRVELKYVSGNPL